MLAAEICPVEENNVCIGVITAVNGIKGYVKVRQFTESPSDIENFTGIFDDSGNSLKFRLITEKKGYVIAAIEGVSSRNQAQFFVGKQLYISRLDLPPTNENEFYHADLFGMAVRTAHGSFNGVVKGIFNFGAGDIIEIHDYNSEKTLYYPFKKQWVTHVDLSGRFLIINHPEEFVASAS